MDNVRVPWDGWKVVRQIGKGSYGTVYEIERSLGGSKEKAAMKVIPIPPNPQILKDYYSDGYDDDSISKICEGYLNDTIDEYKLMKKMSGNTNIVSCYDISYLSLENGIGWEVYIRMELLTPFLNVYDYSVFDEERILTIAKDLCHALILCEENNIVHRDLKPENIFVNEDGACKLGDFGVARILDHSTNATSVGTERYMAPEIVKREPYNNTVDIYSLGLFLYTLLNNNRLPFFEFGKVPSAIERQVANEKRLSGETIPEPQNGNKRLKNIVLKACAYNANERYQSASELLQALNNIVDSNEEIDRNESYENIDNNTQGNSWSFGSETVSYSSSEYAEKKTDNTSADATQKPIIDDTDELPLKEDKQSNNKAKYWIGMVIILVALIALVAMLLFLRSHNSDQLENTSQSTISSTTESDDETQVSTTETSSNSGILMPIYKSDEVINQLEVNESLTDSNYIASIKNNSIYTFRLKWAVNFYKENGDPSLYTSDEFSVVEPEQTVTINVPLDNRDIAKANLNLTPKPVE